MVSRQPRRAAFALAIAATLSTFSGAFASTPPADTIKPVTEVHFSQTSLSDAIDFLRDASGANIDVDWKALEIVGVGKDTPVSLRLRNVAFRVALKKTLDSAAPGLADFYVHDNVITVTSHEVADAQLVTRILPVEDLLFDIPDFTGPTLDLTSTSNSSGGRNASGSGGNNTSGGGGGQSIFNQTDKTSDKQKTRDEKAADLIETIQSTIRPSVWDVNGGKSHIKYFNGKLIITAPVSVQDLIG